MEESEGSGMSRVLRMGAIPAEVSPKARVENGEAVAVNILSRRRVASGDEMLRARIVPARSRQCRHFDQERSLQGRAKIDGDCLVQEFSAARNSGLCKPEFCSSQLRGWKMAGNARLDFGWQDWMTTAKSRQDCLHFNR